MKKLFQLFFALLALTSLSTTTYAKHVPPDRKNLPMVIPLNAATNVVTAEKTRPIGCAEIKDDLPIPIVQHNILTLIPFSGDNVACTIQGGVMYSNATINAASLNIITTKNAIAANSKMPALPQSYVPGGTFTFTEITGALLTVTTVGQITAEKMSADTPIPIALNDATVSTTPATTQSNNNYS